MNKVSKESLKQYVATHQNLIRINNSKEYPELSVLKYARKVFYDGLWDNTLIQLRGTVFDTDFNLKALPFEKTFNRLEQGFSEFHRDEEVVAVRKVNGFMCSVTYVPELGNPIVCTTGSLDSAFCGYARHIIPDPAFFYIMKESFGKDEVRTYLFEIVHPEDPHVVPEEVGAYYLGSRPCTYEEFNLPKNHQTKEHQELYDQEAKEMEVMRPEWKVTRWSDAIEEVKSVKHEGYMCWSTGEYSKSVKLKSPYYSIAKYFGRKKGSHWNEIPKAVPCVFKDYEQLVIDIRTRLEAEFPDFLSLEDEQDKFKIVRGMLDEQKIYNS